MATCEPKKVRRPPSSMASSTHCTSGRSFAWRRPCRRAADSGMPGGATSTLQKPPFLHHQFVDRAKGVCSAWMLLACCVLTVRMSVEAPSAIFRNWDTSSPWATSDAGRTIWLQLPHVQRHLFEGVQHMVHCGSANGDACSSLCDQDYMGFCRYPNLYHERRLHLHGEKAHLFLMRVNTLPTVISGTTPWSCWLPDNK